MKASRILTRKEGLFYGFLLGIILAAVFLILSFFLPHAISSNYYQKSLNQLRSQANTIKKEFAASMTEINQKKEFFQASPYTWFMSGVLHLLGSLGLNTLNYKKNVVLAWDVGTGGNALLAQILAQKGFRVYATDIDQPD